jgi:NAD(P)-dependent dehydrogenase (short-subunit alcohol dehydrogenase family)
MGSKIAVVTGAGRGLGRSMALYLARRGAAWEWSALSGARTMTVSNQRQRRSRRTADASQCFGSPKKAKGGK